MVYEDKQSMVTNVLHVSSLCPNYIPSKKYKKKNFIFEVLCICCPKVFRAQYSLFSKYVMKKTILVYLNTSNKPLTLIFYLCNPSSLFRRQSGSAFITGVENS